MRGCDGLFFMIPCLSEAEVDQMIRVWWRLISPCFTNTIEFRACFRFTFLEAGIVPYVGKVNIINGYSGSHVGMCSLNVWTGR